MKERGSNGLRERALGLVRGGTPVAKVAREVGVPRSRLRGWMAGPSAPPIEQQETPPLAERVPRSWPLEATLPRTYIKRRLLPCVRCRRILLDDGGQAVATTGIPRGDVAYLRCRGCGARWSLPVEER